MHRWGRRRPSDHFSGVPERSGTRESIFMQASPELRRKLGSTPPWVVPSRSGNRRSAVRPAHNRESRLSGEFHWRAVYPWRIDDHGRPTRRIHAAAVFFGYVAAPGHTAG